MSKERIVLGIDPQPKFLSVHLRKESGEILDWFNHHLQKHSRFNNAQSWQEHVYDEVIIMLQRIALTIQTKTKEKRFPDLISCEQQKGRVNSLIEQTILCVCKHLKIKCIIIHPVSWKKATGIPCLKNHYKNKQAVEEVVKPEYMAYMKDRNMDITETRLHDLFDAKKICEAGVIITSKKDKES